MPNHQNARKALSGIRVLDFTRLYAGPFCTMLLGDLGADVAKIEAPGKGDSIRPQAPFWKGHSLSFLAVNRNKRSVVVDIKTDAGRDAVLRMVDKADVVIENFRPGVMDRLGLGYEALSGRRAGLIYASMSGMGADGPSAGEGGFDLTIQAEGGYMSITGERGGAPIKLGTSAFDLICGQYTMGAIVTALFDRERTGRGQKIETSLFEGQISFLVDAAVEWLAMGRIREKWGSQHVGQAPYKAFRTSDGWIVIGAGLQNLFESFARAIGQAGLITDERFNTVAKRSDNRDVLHAILDAEVLKYTTGDLLGILRSAKVPCAPVNDMEAVFKHPQALHRGMLQSAVHPRYGAIPLIGPAVKYSDFDVAAGWTAPPELGEHSAEVFAEWLDLDAAESACLAATVCGANNPSAKEEQRHE